MQLLKINKNYKNFARLIKILSILSHYGFSAFINRIRVGFVSIPERAFNIKRKKSIARYTEPERLRLAIEELGPAFIKMGQILSMRPDIIPPDYAKELEKLQDRTPSTPFNEIKGVIEVESGISIDELFDHIDETPIASASIAQVHKAILKSGELVAVKVLKPKTREIVEKDLSIIQLLVKLASQYIPEIRVYKPSEVVKEFSEILLGELDFLKEANNIERFNKFFKDEQYVHIPNVYREFSTNRMIVMEYIDGIKVSDIEALEEANMDRKIVAENGAKITLKEIFEFGFFHADPHPGNIFVLPGNIIAPVDFGITGYVDEEGVQIIGNILLGLFNRDVDRILRNLRRYDFVKEDIDFRKLKIDLYDLIDETKDIPLSKISVPNSLNAVFSLVRKYRIDLPSEYFLIIKVLLQLDGVGRELYPDFSITENAKPYAEKWFYKQFSLKKYFKEVIYVLEDISHIIKTVPSEFSIVVKRLLLGKFKIPIYHEGLDHTVKEMDRIGNRISFSVIIASLLLSSSIIIQAKVEPIIKGYPVLGLLGFLVAFVMGIWLLISIIGSGRL